MRRSCKREEEVTPAYQAPAALVSNQTWSHLLNGVDISRPPCANVYVGFSWFLSALILTVHPKRQSLRSLSFVREIVLFADRKNNSRGLFKLQPSGFIFLPHELSKLNINIYVHHPMPDGGWTERLKLWQFKELALIWNQWRTKRRWAVSARASNFPTG